MHIVGTAFPPHSSERQQARLDVVQGEFCLFVDNHCIFTDDQTLVEVSTPVGNVPIHFEFSNGWVFFAERTTELNHWLKAHYKKSSLLDKIESNVWAWIISLPLCIAMLLGGYFYVLPWISGQLTRAIPSEVTIALGDQILESFDKTLTPSELSKQKQEAIRLRANEFIQQLEPLPYPVQIVFRSSDIGANAFALPGGKIILLDDLVKLAENDQQLDSIILHEIGHIHYQHMMTQLVHSSLVSVGVAFMTGESSGVIDNLVGVGVFFLSNGHSRDAEREVDLYAREAMIAIYGTSDPMAEMFELFQQESSAGIPEWLSSHPDLEARIQSIRIGE